MHVFPQLVKCLTSLLGAQVGTVWSESSTQRVFQLLLNYTVHPKPKVTVKAITGVLRANVYLSAAEESLSRWCGVHAEGRDAERRASSCSSPYCCSLRPRHGEGKHRDHCPARTGHAQGLSRQHEHCCELSHLLGMLSGGITMAIWWDLFNSISSLSVNSFSSLYPLEIL